jgi:hypothetical protein
MNEFRDNRNVNTTSHAEPDPLALKFNEIRDNRLSMALPETQHETNCSKL